MDVANLNEKIIRFCRRLRVEGMKVSQADSLTAIQAVSHLFVLDQEGVYYALRAALCFSPEEYKLFDRVFRGFWGNETVHAGKEHRGEEEKDRSKKEGQEPNITER